MTSIFDAKQKITSAFVILLLTVLIVWQAASPIQRIQSINLQYAVDFSDDATLVGASQNIFVARVIKEIGTKERGIGPETQFEVQIVDNIKGDLKGSVTVDQQGGYKNGVLCVVADDTSSATPKNGYLLKPGSTYLLATRYNPTGNWYTVNPYPTASKLLSSDSGLSPNQLKALAFLDTRVQQLRAAYPHEKLLEVDVKHHNTPNSYASVQAAAAATQ